MRPELHTMFDLGFAFFPLAGKAPITTHGFKDATRDREVLSRTARRYPGCNWGGLRRGTICLDVDPRNGGTINGLDIDLTATLVVETGSGGLHIYYEWAGGKVRGKLAGVDGIDLKNWVTGYLVMPGSVHPDTGRPYTIAHHATPAPFPAHLRERVEQPRRSQWTPSPSAPTGAVAEKRNAGLIRRVAEASDGGRNDMAYWGFCRAIERGADPQLIDDIRGAALSTGLSEREVDTCLRSAQNTIRGAVA